MHGVCQRLRFLKRSLLLVMILALLAMFHYQIAVHVNRHLLLVAATTCVASFVVAISIGERRSSHLLAPAALAMFLSACSIFTHCRLYASLDESFPRPLPYPDTLITSIVQSIPSPRHQPNRTWEAILVAVNLSAILFSVASGTQLGMVFRRCRQSRDNNGLQTKPSTGRFDLR